MSLVSQYLEAYFAKKPETVQDYFDTVYFVDPDAVIAARPDGAIWIRFSDGSERKLGDPSKPADRMDHHDA